VVVLIVDVVKGITNSSDRRRHLSSSLVHGSLVLFEAMIESHDVLMTLGAFSTLREKRKNFLFITMLKRVFSV